ncbi:hypothetical protein IWX85_000993 [Polaromonas sp. CG_9.11]|nr:hypothetical protein [Polaromonas sp. CG_9.11]
MHPKIRIYSFAHSLLGITCAPALARAGTIG